MPPVLDCFDQECKSWTQHQTEIALVKPVAHEKQPKPHENSATPPHKMHRKYDGISATPPVKQVGDTPALMSQISNRATVHRSVVNGIPVEVLKIGDDVISAYPTGF